MAAPPPYTPSKPGGYPQPIGYPQPVGYPQPGGYPPSNAPQQLYPPAQYPPPQPAVVMTAPASAGAYPTTVDVIAVPPTIIVQQNVSLGFRSAVINCPYCHQNITTIVSYESGNLTWLAVGGLCLCQCYLCCCIPLCMDDFKDCQHNCPACNKLISIQRRL